jgi:hypothetical protein
MVIGTTALTLGAFNLIPQLLRGMMPK